MSKKNTKNTKGKIITAAWDLFYEQGYEDTTIEEIIETLSIIISRVKMRFWVLCHIFLTKSTKGLKKHLQMI